MTNINYKANNYNRTNSTTNHTRKRNRVKVPFIQRLIGIALIILSFITGYVANGDYTASIILIPLGLTLIFSKKKWIY